MRIFPRRMRVAKTLLVPFVYFFVFMLFVFGPGSRAIIITNWTRHEVTQLETMVSKARALPEGSRSIRSLQKFFGAEVFPAPGYGMMILSQRPGLGAEVISLNAEEVAVSVNGSYIYGYGCEGYFSHGLYSRAGNSFTNGIWKGASIEMRSAEGKSRLFRHDEYGGESFMAYPALCPAAERIIIRFALK